MKRILLFIICLISLASQATTYQIANQAAKDAFNFASLVAGDNVLFQRGQTFTGSITVSVSGTAGNPITFGAYGTGANPIISGFAQVASWTNLGSNIWESTNAVSTLSYMNIVTINGVNTAMGRTPNVGSYYYLQSHTGNSSITSSNLTGTPNWTGAEVCQRKENWIWESETITSQSGSTINFTNETGRTPRDGNGFFIQADSRTLDVQNEWYYNPTTKKIRIYSISQPVNVYVPTVERVIDSYNKSYVTLENLTIIGGNSYNVKFQTGSNIIVSNCNILKSGQFAVSMYDLDNYQITSNTIKNSNFVGISTWQSGTGDNEVITNNVIDSTMMIVGVQLAAASAAILTDVDHSLVQYNTINHSGYDGIFPTGQHGQVRNNFIQNSLNWTADGGGIYTAGANTALIIDGNIILNSIGYPTGGTNYNGARGIYLDINSSNVTVSNNTVYQCWEGIYLNVGTDHNTITGNTVFDCTTHQMSFNNSSQGGYGSLGSVNNNVLTNNIFVAKRINTGIQFYDDQLTLYAYSEFDDITGFISSASGNIYARPIDDTNSIRAYQTSTSTPTDNSRITLAQWKTFSGLDANSTKAPKAITSESDIEIRYNATSSPVQTSFSWAGVNMAGVQYTSSPTIQPYSSLVLIKNIPNDNGTLKPAGTQTEKWGENGLMWGFE